MTRKLHLEQKIEAAMSSLGNLAPASPAPFFYTRLMARMAREEKSVWGRLSRAITRPAIAGVSVAFILVINIFVVLHHIPSAAPDQAEIAVADEYNRTTTLYNIDNVQP